MLLDIAGTELIPGKRGEDCPGNGTHTDTRGNPIECCCEECNYAACCLETHHANDCNTCTDFDCPRAVKNRP